MNGLVRRGWYTHGAGLASKQSLSCPSWVIAGDMLIIDRTYRCLSPIADKVLCSTRTP